MPPSADLATDAERWGSIGLYLGPTHTHGHSLTIFSDDRIAAQVKIARAIKHRLKRGYQLAEWQ